MDFARTKKKRSVASLEVTPLVDIVFLLLIFFLLTATYVKNPNIDIKLPNASSQNVYTKDDDISIAIKKDGVIILGETKLSASVLEKELRQKRKLAGDKTVVIIRADKGTRHGRVVEVMDIVKKTGFERLAIAVKEKVGSQ